MILVDTTVWIDFFANRQTVQVKYLINQIIDKEDLCICGVILTEIFQGIKNPKEQKLIENAMRPLIFIDMTRDTFLIAADIYRNLRKKGITIRKTIDCMIAAVSFENDIPLLHNDKDFEQIGKFYHIPVVALH